MRIRILNAYGLAGISAMMALAGALSVHAQLEGRLDLLSGILIGALLVTGLGSCLSLVLVRKAILTRDEAVRLMTASQHRFQRLVETAHAGIWMVDNDGRCVFANRSLGDMLQCPPEALMGRTVYAYLGDNTASVMIKLMAGATTEAFDLSYRRENGQIGWALVSSRPMTDEQDNPIGTLLMLTDITARKEAELALAAVHTDLESRIRQRTGDLQIVNNQLRAEFAVREAAERALLASEQRLHDIISMMPIAVFVKDAQLNIVMMNDACAEQWGVTLPQIAGTRAQHIFPVEQLRNYHEHDMAVFASGKCEKREVLLWHHKLGENRLLETYKKPIFDAEGKPLYLICMCFDITERKRNEDAHAVYMEQLRQLTSHLETVKDEERQRIARDIHDDLGQNLLALKIDVAMLHARTTRHPRLHARAASVLGTIDATIRSVRTIINDLHPSTLELGLGPAVEWLVGEVEKRSGIECRLQLDGEDRNDLDPRRRAAVFRLVQESLNNVMRHSSAEHAAIRLDIGDDQLRVEIADDGVGMDLGSTIPGGKFGLRGMHERVGALGGELEIVSRPGKGTRLKMKLPTRAEKRETATIGEKQRAYSP